MAIYLHINHRFGTISVRDQTKPYKGNYTILYASSVFLPFKFLKRQINSKNTSKTIKLCPLYFDLLPLIKCLCDSHDVLVLTVLSYVSIDTRIYQVLVWVSRYTYYYGFRLRGNIYFDLFIDIFEHFCLPITFIHNCGLIRPFWTSDICIFLYFVFQTYSQIVDGLSYDYDLLLIEIYTFVNQFKIWAGYHSVTS